MDFKELDTGYKATIPIFTEEDERFIDNHFNEIDDFINKLGHAKDLAAAQHIIQKQQEEIEKKDTKVKNIITRLDNDIKNITETKAKKSYHYLDDYTRCRLKAYRTKTREIRDYIKEQYFESKV